MSDTTDDILNLISDEYEPYEPLLEISSLPSYPKSPPRFHPMDDVLRLYPVDGYAR